MEHKEFEKRIERKIENRIAKMVAIAVMVVVAFIAFVFIGGVVVQALWNWLVPTIFGLPTLDFWQALGLLALTRILFGSFSMGGGKGGGWRNHKKGRHHGPPHLTDEEREHLKRSDEPATSAS
jgi:hypothetical protein